jgi:hypothetical protein
MPEAGVNYLAVVVAAIIYMVLGFLWYGPLFGRQWMKLSNITPSGMSGGAMAKTTLGSFIGALVMSYVLARVVDWMGATTVGTGIEAGCWMWLGFVATVTLNSIFYERRPVALYVLNNAYYLVALAIAGALFAVWG